MDAGPGCFTTKKTGDLIAMAHHTRQSDNEKTILGNTVQQVVLRSACPVASVNHPDKIADL
jgi:nucleotide-binding universal stress UspA family protein